MSNETLTQILATLTPVYDRKEGVGGFTDPATGVWVTSITPGSAEGEALIGNGTGKMYRLSDVKAALLGDRDARRIVTPR